MPPELSCEVLQESKSTTVLQRRGFTLPEISITPQDFGQFNLASANYDSSSPIIFLQSLSTPKTACLQNLFENVNQLSRQSSQEQTSATPKFVAEEDVESYLTDIQQEGNFPPSSDSQKENNNFMNLLSNSMNNNNKVNLFTPQKFDNTYTFFENYNFDSKNIELVLPKSKDLITPDNPVVVKRINTDNQDEFDIYFPSPWYSSSPSLSSDLDKQDKRNGNIFVFPDSSCKENQQIFPPFFDHTINPFCNNLLATNAITNSTNVMNPCNNNTNFYAMAQTRKLKRNQNEMERQRRVDQHVRFQRLRESIPHIINKRKTAKITILQAAISYIQQLHQEESILEQTKSHEKKRSEVLMRKLYQLKNTQTLHQKQ